MWNSLLFIYFVIYLLHVIFFLPIYSVYLFFLLCVLLAIKFSKKPIHWGNEQFIDFIERLLLAQHQRALPFALQMIVCSATLHSFEVKKLAVSLTINDLSITERKRVSRKKFVLYPVMFEQCESSYFRWIDFDGICNSSRGRVIISCNVGWMKDEMSKFSVEAKVIWVWIRGVLKLSVKVK